MRYLYIYFAILMLFTACDKKEVVELNFKVKANRTALKVGDTVTFSIEGNPEQLTFFSGEKGFNYDHRERLNSDGKVGVEFTTTRTFGSRENTLALMVSTDFSGKYNAEGIAAAEWKDLTNKVILSTGIAKTPSGFVDLSSFKSDKPFFLAFKFQDIKFGGTTQRTWVIENLLVSNEDEGTKLSVATIANASWTVVSLNNSPQKWTFKDFELRFQGGNATVGDNLGWIISKPLFLTKVSPDIGQVLKNMSTRITTYQYVYSKEGKFKATFVASNQNRYGTSSAVQQIEINVEP